MKTRLLAALLLVTGATGCFLTKLVTVPMRVGGAAISVIPVVGNTADDAIAEVVDEVPL